MSFAPPYRAIFVSALLFASSHPAARQSASRTIPIQVVLNLVYMQGKVNHSGPLSVSLDTGSTMTIVSPAVAKKAGLTSSQNMQAAGEGKGADETLHLFDDAELDWGPPGSGLHLMHQKGAILPIDYISKETGKRDEALFGSNIFLNYTVTVDYLRQRATFIPKDAGTHVRGTPIPIQIFGNVPFAIAKIRGEDGKEVSGLFFLDSGNAGTVTLNGKFLKAHSGLIAKNHFVKAPSVTAVGGAIHYSRTQIAGLSIGPFAFSNVPAVVPDTSAGVLANDSVAGTIGAGLLSRFTVTWDYARKKLYLQPNSTFSRPFENASIGVHLIAPGPDYRAVKIDQVLPGSPAALAGLMPGDQIVAVNGEKGLPLWRVEKFLTKAGSTARLTIKRKNSVIEMKVRPENPLEHGA